MQLEHPDDGEHQIDERATGRMSEALRRPRPFLFGEPGRSLYGMLHPAVGGQAGKPSVLLCNPFGQEAITAHRTFRVLADRMARAGHSALRFDYYGTGESGGEDTDVTLAGMCDDVETASRQLAEETGQAPICWIGLGLGAMLAWMVAARATRPPARLLLWDPVFDGPAYLETLRQQHAEACIKSLSLPSARVRPAGGVMEALGFALSPELQNDIAAMTPERLPPLPDQLDTIIVAPSATEAAGSATSRRGLSSHKFRPIELTHEMSWMNETIHDGTVVPAAALIRLAGLVGEVP